MLPFKINEVLLNAEGLAQVSFQENRKGRVLGLYVKRPGLETHSNVLKM